MIEKHLHKYTKLMIEQHLHKYTKFAPRRIYFLTDFVKTHLCASLEIGSVIKVKPRVTRGPLCEVHLMDKFANYMCPFGLAKFAGEKADAG